MGFIENTKSHLLNKIDELSHKLRELELLETGIEGHAGISVDHKIATFLEILPGVIYQTESDERRTLKHISPQCFTVFGYSKKEIENEQLRNLDFLVHPNDRDFVHSEIHKVNNSNKRVYSIDYRVIKRDGSIIWVNDLGTCVINDEGKIEYLTGFISDITGRKSEEETRQKILILEEALTKASGKLIQSKPDINEILNLIGIAAGVDRVSIFTMQQDNKVMANQYEYCKAGLLSPKESIHEFEISNFPWWMKKLWSAESIIVEDVNRLPEEASVEKSVLVNLGIQAFTVFPLYSKAQGLIGFIEFDDLNATHKWIEYELAFLHVISESITNYLDRREYEKKILEAKHAAEKSEKLKTEFLAQMSHEIRTPINVMLSFSSFLQDKFSAVEKDEEAELSFQSIKAAGKRLIRTIDLLLDMSEIQAESYEYNPKLIDLNIDILNNLKPEFSELARQKGVEFEYSFEIGKEYEIYADEYAVNQIFANLIDNAIKYTREGKVTVHLGTKNRTQVFAEVSDTGIGMGSEYLGEIFQAFNQEDKGYTRRFEGSGLGLALVKKYCELNNATVEVESKKDSGSTFRIIFPHPSEERWDST